jgi:hypothetical protein
MVILAFAALLDPEDDILHLKVPAFALLMAVWLWRRGFTSRTVSVRIWAMVLGAALTVPLVWTVIGLLQGNAHTIDPDFAMLKSFLFLLLVPVVLVEDIDLASLIVRMGFLVAALTLVIVAVASFFPLAFDVLYAFSREKQNAIISQSRDTLGIGAGMFYYKTSPLLVFPLAWYAGRLFQPGSRKLIPLMACVLYAAALLFSGARANFLAGLFVIGALAFVWLRRKSGLIPASVTAVAVVTLFSATVMTKLANPEETSNSIKLAHISSYEEEFGAHPTALLWGEGADSAFYTEGFQDWTTVTELSYLELIRVFGLPMALLFGAGLVWIAIALFRNKLYPFGLAYVVYLVICASNPLLISSTGFLAICAAWKEAVKPSTPASAFQLSAPLPAAAGGVP